MASREGSMVVNSSQGGGSKDTWVLGLQERLRARGHTLLVLDFLAATFDEAFQSRLLPFRATNAAGMFRGGTGTAFRRSTGERLTGRPRVGGNKKRRRQPWEKAGAAAVYSLTFHPPDETRLPPVFRPQRAVAHTDAA